MICDEGTAFVESMENCVRRLFTRMNERGQRSSARALGVASRGPSLCRARLSNRRDHKMRRACKRSLTSHMCETVVLSFSQNGQGRSFCSNEGRQAAARHSFCHAYPLALEVCHATPTPL
jgi:hypothetical protein